MDARLNFLFENSNDFFCVLNLDGTIVYANNALVKASGYQPAEFEGKSLIEFCHPADVKVAEALQVKLTAHTSVKSCELRIRIKDGRFLNIRWSLILKMDDGLVYGTGVDLTRKLNQPEEDMVTDRIQHIVQSFNEGFFIIDPGWKIISFNPAFQAITGLTVAQLTDLDLRNVAGLAITANIKKALDGAFATGVSDQLQYFNEHSRRWLRLNVYPYKNELTIFMRDITGIKVQQSILALEKQVLELNSSSPNSLPHIIDQLLLGIEEIYPDMICSVLEVDDAQERVHHLSAPRVPTGYIRAINDTLIGPRAGSCGAAAYHRTQVIVKDIATDPLWDDYRALILPYGLRACWSTPIMSSHGLKVLATFAVYYTEARGPKNEELQMIERTTNILRILIENKKTQEHIAHQTDMLQEIASISSHELRRPVATILGLVNLFDRAELHNPMNQEIINHLDTTARELDDVIHSIVEKTVYLKAGVITI